MLPFSAAAPVARPETNPLQAAAAAAIGAKVPIHFDLGRRPRMSAEPDLKTTKQPAIAMTFHGGPVQVSATTYLIWWLPSGAHLPANYQQVVTNYFADIGGSALYGVLTGYTGSNGPVRNRVPPGGAWTDAAAYPQSIQYADVSKSLKRALAANPNWKTGLDAQFYVLTAQNAPVNADQFCAYHSYLNLPGGANAIFAYVPDPAAVDGCQTPFNVSPNRDLDVDSATTSINHEQAEMTTDPLITSWFADSKDKYVNGQEVADVCIYDFGIPLRPDGANMVFANGDEFMAQELFDPLTSNCAPTL